MSRSFRRPYVTDGYKGSKRRQFEKRYSNKVLRKVEEIADGKAFKKFTDSWDICDFKWFEKDIKKHWPNWWKLIRK